jgi:deoxycytidylate deaminase
MEALLSAARNGIAIRGGTLYTTTYPCHNCAKHIVAAGIKKVKFVEPYPKSYATKMHSDSIESNGEGGTDKVRFEPFVGIGPRRFVDLFSMSLSSGRNITRKQNSHLIEWTRETAELRVPMAPLSYLEAEVSLVNELSSVVSSQEKRNEIQ